MATVFINYRTGDGEKTALLIDRELSGILGGEDHVFRATRSIKPGQRFPEELLGNVRRATVVLAVIGPAWARSPRLRDKDDWVRRELLEAFTFGIPVVPVLEGPGARRLDPADLPLELKWLAEVQSERLDVEDLQAGLRRLFTRLAEWIPSLGSVVRPDLRPVAPDSGSVSNTADSVHGPLLQGRDITAGDVGTGIKNNHGIAHLGSGNVYRDSQHFSGDGATYVAGDSHGGIGHRFGNSREDGEGKR
ncbi:toll/interleukin-1 receptor domain-containing protein [Planomonospora sp. ID91781]|uniref:toll/interleukin-1 receptor domain-containing protein n=1 Tax=Planomonospora sp. ID91781 TaxID=2738135 RepID=UPI0018C408F2|nr:toll/interleukin-1 receptor domain-containing protein [Planomonospora sp. ID91781]MBG0821710.1 toll/interleukin-1 receptor domain-containing protein [Planomonospora sp. ID91781]